VEKGQELAILVGHADRVLAGAVAPDGSWAATGGRDGALKLWNLPEGSAAGSANHGAEIRGCFFFLDGQTLGIVDVMGRVRLHTVPDLEVVGELATGLKVECADLSPSNAQIALGCKGGQVERIAVDDFDRAPLAVTVTEANRRTATRLQRLLGKSTVVNFFQCRCPVCRQFFELSTSDPAQQTPCPSCQRRLRVGGVVRAPADSEKPSPVSR
jgi:hypothetical protein